MTKRNDPPTIMETLDGDRVYGHLDMALHHAKTLKDRTLNALIKDALERMEHVHQADEEEEF